MTSFVSSALAASVVNTPNSFQNPTLVGIWLSVGLAGLVAGMVAVTVADRRRRNQAPLRREVAVLAAADTELLNAA